MTCARRGLLLAWLLASCAKPPAAVTVPGPEVGGLAEGLRGHLVFDAGGGSIEAVSLPRGTRSVVRSKCDSHVYVLSGPDAEGRIAYVEDHYGSSRQRHLLKTIGIDGTKDTVVFERPGSVMWASAPGGNGVMGSVLALAPTGGLVAFVSGLRSKQPREPKYVGTLEVWDTVRRQQVTTVPDALSHRISWFPDGKRGLYVRHVPRAEVPSDARDLMEGTWRQSDPVPAIHRCDIATGRSSFVQVGLDSLVAPDGADVFVVDALEKTWFRVDLSSGRTTQVRWPIGAVGLIATAGQDLVVYCGLPTEGAEIRYMEHYSPMVGPRPLGAIKLARIGTGEFQTLLPHFDPRHSVSFGIGPK